MSADSYDSSILSALIEDSRTPLTEIGQKAGLSRFTVKKRVEKLLEDGVIIGPTVVLNPTLIGFKRTVFFEFKTNPHEPWFAKFLEKIAVCDLLDGITGEYSLFGRFRMTDDEHFNLVLKKMDEAVAKSSFKKHRVVNAIRTFKEAGVPFPTQQTNVKLDDIDLKLIEILLNQTQQTKLAAPLTTVEISHILNKSGIKISQPAVFQRLTTLEKKGVILRNTIVVNWNKLGIATKVIVRIKANPSMYEVVAHDFLAPMNEITDLYRTGEEYGLLATVRVHSVSDYNAFLLKLYDIRDVIDTHTTLVLEERKNSPTYLPKE